MKSCLGSMLRLFRTYDSKKLRVDASSFRYGEKISVFENTRLRVDGKYDSKTLRVDADFFEYGGKNLRFRKYPATCGRGLN